MANACLLGSRFYVAVFCGPSVFYLLAGSGALWRLRPKLLMLPFYFSMINAAAVVGFYHALGHRRRLLWE